ncbi:P-loop containing nucleoside triphosphate hydrolase protein [Jackrogersella minutella]|nr:P-loop containing nucleoside triphosphate hydrolase protein [Jackrogersella minutella]
MLWPFGHMHIYGTLHFAVKEEEVSDFTRQLQSAGLREKRLKEKLLEEEKRRRSLFEEVQKLRGAIRVICRIRPDSSPDLLDYETQNGELHSNPAKLTVIEYKETPRGETRAIKSETYEFERIFLPRETNEDVFSEISSFVQSVIDGKKACVFCYGQSGTGKTYTMSNLDEVESREEGVDYKNDGIIPRVKTMIFREKERLDEIGYSMTTRGCCYEIYNNELWLLKASGNKKKTISRNTRTIENPELVTLSSASDFDALVKVGMKNRHFGATKLNNNSSRSHFIISLETSISLKGTSDVKHEGLLNLVDLGGAERTEQAGTTGVQFQEGTNINISLSELGKVIKTLAEGKNPTFNGNILTGFLQRSLERGCMTLMFLMISPLKENWPTTTRTLNFAKEVQSARQAKSSKRGKKVVATRSPSNRLPRLAQRPGAKQ